MTVEDASAGAVYVICSRKTANAFSISAPRRAEDDAYSGSRSRAQVMAVDIDEQRLSRVYDNLKRLGVKRK